MSSEPLAGDGADIHEFPRTERKAWLLQPHDRLFRHTFSSPSAAAALLRSQLPRETLAELEWASIRVEAETHVDHRLRKVESDLVVSAKVDGRDALFYALVEHQSRVEREMPLRLWRYAQRLIERWTRRNPGWRSLPRVLPIVIYAGPGPWTAPLDLHELVAPVPENLELHFRYLVDDLGESSVDELMERSLPAFGILVLLLLRAAVSRRFADTLEYASDLVLELMRGPDGAEALATLLRYISIVLGEDGPETLHESMNRLPETAREDVMHYFARTEERARQEGRQEGAARTLSKLLRARFGELPVEMETRLAEASPAELDRWAERVLSAEALADVFAS